MPMTEEERQKQALKEARAAEREAREQAELAHKPKEPTGIAAMFNTSPVKNDTQPALGAAPSVPGITLPSLPSTSNNTGGLGLGMFGQNQNNNQARPALSILGAASNQNQPSTQPAAPSLSIFGAANNNTQQQQQRPTLASMPPLGSSQTTSQPPAAPTANAFSTFQFPKPAGAAGASQQPLSGGIFSQPSGWGSTQQSQPQSQPQAGASLFGAPAQQSTSIFGAPGGSAFQTNAGTSTSGWGQPATQGSSLFGQSGGAFGGLGGFGASVGQQQQQQGFSGGTLGLSQLTQSMRAPQQQPGNNAPPPLQPQSVTRAARYDDLAENDKGVVKVIDEHIRTAMDVAKELRASTVGNEILSLSGSIKKVINDATIVKDNYRVADVMARHVQMQMDGDLKDATAAVGIIDKFHANPKQPGHASWQLEYPVKYFTRTEAQMRERLHGCKNTMQQIESLLRDSYRHEQRSAKEISNSMSSQTSALLSLAGQTADLDAKIQQLKADYTRLYRAKTGSARDPFGDVPGRPAAPA